MAKVLEACGKSKIFAPPNVWVMAHMRLLVEIYTIPELKLNLKFEIELLCNNLGLDINGNSSLCSRHHLLIIIIILIIRD